jgi:hypothetical protein
VLGLSQPERVSQGRRNLEKWAEMISSGSINSHKEHEILRDFINDVFCDLLGYTRAADSPKRYAISREKHVEANGKFADVVLGESEAKAIGQPVIAEYVAVHPELLNELLGVAGYAAPAIKERANSRASFQESARSA